MALPLGIENKKQVYIVVALFAVIAVVAAWEIFGSASTPSAPVRPPTPAVAEVQHAAAFTDSGAGASTSAGPDAQKLNESDIDPRLHLDQLAESENVEYAGTGRNIFSAESVPVHVETPIAPARPGMQLPVVPSGPPPPPKPPSIDLRYFGYSQTKDKTLKAYLVHGDDVFMAKSGDVIDHRYKVNDIQPASVEITDLSYNNTQKLPLTAN
jgi:hypothetical protein